MLKTLKFCFVVLEDKDEGEVEYDFFEICAPSPPEKMKTRTIFISCGLIGEASSPALQVNSLNCYMDGNCRCDVVE